jgi:hypothetical protein
MKVYMLKVSIIRTSMLEASIPTAAVDGAFDAVGQNV